MQVMVHMLINNRRLLRRTLKLLLIDRALVPSRIICGLLPRRAIITVDILLLALLLVVMLLWQDLGVLQRLDGGVVVVLGFSFSTNVCSRVSCAFLTWVCSTAG